MGYRSGNLLGLSSRPFQWTPGPLIPSQSGFLSIFIEVKITSVKRVVRVLPGGRRPSLPHHKVKDPVPSSRGNGRLTFNPTSSSDAEGRPSPLSSRW